MDENFLAEDGLDTRADIRTPRDEQGARFMERVEHPVNTNGGVTLHFHLHLSENASTEQIETVLSNVAKHLLGRETQKNSHNKRATIEATDNEQDEELELPFKS